MIQKECRRCGFFPIPYRNECLACLDKKRAEYEGQFGYWGEDEEDTKPPVNTEERRKSANIRLEVAEQIRPLRPEKRETPAWKLRMRRLLEGHRNVSGMGIVDAVDSILAGGVVRHCGAKPLQQHERGAIQPVDILFMEPSVQEEARGILAAG